MLMAGQKQRVQFRRFAVLCAKNWNEERDEDLDYRLEVGFLGQLVKVPDKLLHFILATVKQFIINCARQIIT